MFLPPGSSFENARTGRFHAEVQGQAPPGLEADHGPVVQGIPQAQLGGVPSPPGEAGTAERINAPHRTSCLETLADSGGYAATPGAAGLESLT